MSEWWRTAVVYQIYIRSFSDSSGSGTGDVAGLRERLDHLVALGVDAVWINPWYPSPQADAGYDVADYRDVEPAYGTLVEGEELIALAHERGIKVILDIVPNHTSSAHRWWRAALAGDQAARARYLIRDGRGEDGQEPPNDWTSAFGGPSWTRMPAAAVGGSGAQEWYLHLFAPEQPDLDWTNPEVREEFEDVLAFWFDRGVDGFRIDVAHGLGKAEGLPDAGPSGALLSGAPHPAWDQDEVHEIYRGWRRVADAYSPPRVFVAEAWVVDNQRLGLYLRSDELHTAFQFDLLRAPFVASSMRETVEDAIAAATQVGAAPTWVLANHDVVRQVTRYARSQPVTALDPEQERARWSQEPADIELGRRRARAAVLAVLALPGTAYLYQGEELGLPEVEDIADDRRDDPIWEQSDHTDVGRDGCRVPLPWSGTEAPYGFSPQDAPEHTWLPQPDDWAGLTAAAQQDDPSSTLTTYRRAVRLRREHWVDAPDLIWLDAPEHVLAFARGELQCWINTGAAPVELPAGEVLLISDGSAPTTHLPPATGCWLATT